MKSPHISSNLRWGLLCCVKYILFNGIWYQIPALSHLVLNDGSLLISSSTNRAAHSSLKALKKWGGGVYKETIFFFFSFLSSSSDALGLIYRLG